MDRLHSPFSSPSPSGPQTPPYTPHSNVKGKRRFEPSRSHSPASIHPAETTSPAKKKAARQEEELKAAAEDTVRVQELVEGDVGYATDIDVVYPDELEEVISLSSSSSHIGRDGEDDNGFTSSSGLSDNDSETAAMRIARRLSRLRCAEDEDGRNGEAEFEHARRLRRLSKRMEGRAGWAGKRRHSKTIAQSSESVSGGAGSVDGVDEEARDDQDVVGSQRRLRRRVKGPSEGDDGEGSGRSADKYVGKVGGRRAEIADDEDVMEVDEVG